MEAPLRTIQAGVELAVAEDLPAVYVAAGQYEATHEDGEAIELLAPIELLGGFSADDWPTRDPSVHVTRIVDLSASPAGTTRSFPHHPVHVQTEAGMPVIDGFTLVAAPSGFAAALSITGGEASVTGNVLLGNAQAEESIGASVRYASPTLEDNRIDAVGAQSVALAVHCQSSDPVLRRNEIVAGTEGLALPMVYEGCDGTIASNLIASPEHQFGTTVAVALEEYSSPAIVANTIVKAGTSNGEAAFISLDTATQPVVVGNNFVHAGEGQSWCLYASFALPGEVIPDPAVLTHNNFGCTALYRRFEYEEQIIGTILELESTVAGAADNVQGDPGVVDAMGDYHLRDDGTAPCDVVQGGSDQSELAGTTDLDDVPRTEPWSVGAYELDGPCL